MDTIFMNSNNSKTSDPQRLLIFQIKYVQRGLILSDLKILPNLTLLYQISYTWKNIKKSYKNNKFKMSTPMQGLPDGSYFVSDN